MKNLIQISVLIILFTGFFACEKVPTYPETPRIEFKNLEVKRTFSSTLATEVDSITVTIYFEDGDGDLGTNSTDTSIQNYYIEMLRREDGIYNNVPLLSPGKKFPLLAPSEEYLGPLDGTLSLRTGLAHGLDINNPGDPDGLRYGDTIKFNVSIEDRAGHRSNEVETSTHILVP